MSFDDLRGGFTELEIEAGIPSLCFFSENRATEIQAKDYLTCNEKLILKHKEIRFYLEQEWSSLALKNSLVHSILIKEIPYIIRNYFKKENLPVHYFNLINESRCIEILVKGMLVKVAKIPIDRELDLKIRRVIDMIGLNAKMITPYYRVNYIQQFIHNEVDSRYGVGYHEKLPARHMRCLLSTVRLSISLRDIENEDGSHLQEMIRLTRIESEKEGVNNYDVPLNMSGKIYVPKWRVKHMKHISYYAKEMTRTSLQAIEDIYSLGNNELEIIQKITEYYVNSDFIRPGGSHVHR